MVATCTRALWLPSAPGSFTGVNLGHARVDLSVQKLHTDICMQRSTSGLDQSSNVIKKLSSL